MNKITEYADILAIRTRLKKIQQVSWSISQLEKKYPIQGLSEEEYPYIFEAYALLEKELLSIYDELKNENKNYSD